MVEKIAAGTRERLLVAAERLLLVEPYDEVSVRGICTAAGANPAAVHYHFGSKEALVGALLEDRLGPVWFDQLTELTAAPAPVADLVDAVLTPFTELAADPVGRLHLRLLARFVMRREAAVWQQHWFRMDSWAGLLPGVGESEAGRRWMLAFELIITQFGSTRDREPSVRAVATLRDFVVAGLTAPTGESQ
ncbi:TetR/AcrR family transcriptional regulator [Nocardia jejuensis]|uniref:TetR/AcrR family transcriptional regulator n=1 Tax=Nocardia jejuensis TaxID=328049 RepID=UPI0008331517|nr:TetR/AcrR family transcriptional regulator [Nocardia jejuensis]